MTERYFATARLEVLPYLPRRVERLLDIGCGAGATVAAIKAKTNSVVWAGGVEIVEDQAKRAADGICDRVWSIDIERDMFEAGIPAATLDLVLCLDVLEHLVDPWRVVERLTNLLRPGGRLIVSVPNIRNWKFVKNLLLKGDFNYRDSGLLDRTHLRFFVRATAEALASTGGLTMIENVALPVLKTGETRWLLNKMLFGGLEDILAKQWLIVAECKV